MKKCGMNPFARSDLFNIEFQFRDSEVSCVRAVNGDVHVSLSAASARRSAGAPGGDARHGYVQAVELCLHQAAWSGRLNECVGGLSDGELKVDGAAIPWVSLPFQGVGNIALTLAFSNGTLLCAEATQVSVSQRGQPQFTENFAC